MTMGVSALKGKTRFSNRVKQRFTPLCGHAICGLRIIVDMNNHACSEKRLL